MQSLINRTVVKPIAVRDRGINSYDGLQLGEMGTIMGGAFKDHVVLRAYDVVVDLTSPNNTWRDSAWAPEVKKLNTGDVVEVTQGFTQATLDELRSIRSVNEINAIKRLREITNWGFKEAREYVDNVL